MKKILTFVLCLVIALSSFSVVCAADLGIFSDVDVTTDEGIAILTLYVEGIIKGYGDGTFGVDKALTRAEFARMINLIFGYTGSFENKFKDVNSEDWFYEDVLIAINAGYIAGFEDNTFRGNDNVTRQQVCSVVNRIIKAPEKTEHIKISDNIDSWAEKDVRAIVDNGYMKTESGDTFRATQNIKRGELALLLAQFVDDSDYTIDAPEKPEDENKETEEAPSSSSSNSGVSRPTGGNRPSGGSNNSSSSSGSENDTTEEPEIPPVTEEPVDNTEVLVHLQKVITEINGVTFVDKESEMIGYVKTAIESTIEAGKSGEKLTDDYVQIHFDSEISKVKSIYNGMTEEERDAFVMKIAAFDMETLAYLQEYFLE